MLPSDEKSIVRHTVREIFNAMRYSKQQGEADNADNELYEQKMEAENKAKMAASRVK
jgi:hypothetical protein